ncbi:TPA: hypothetical protein ACIU9R_002171 [Salmonella enterica subsp. enterica serovar Birkenhead]|uniref:hypothetical protein n=1 Tax=Salmonella enterica TaxID=28901 RepID=UPI0012A84C88|nr:hypothetical protein [Salmonella enterica]EDV0048143.1 hypothetical protein [Salmonella enterica subsp. enterica serovar Birkenhead]EHI3950882.1 hypothetical protein [Salmonella enterica]EHI6135255.1 hypothetical protein [Salmonella enterica]EHI7993416.1 hypothetical protein [Salmonella enterica]EHI7998070.1 hypothetical protein [Salmonella enterica]
MHKTTDVTGHKALAVLRSFTADMREWGVTVSSEGGRLENGKYPTLSLFFVQAAID